MKKIVLATVLGGAVLVSVPAAAAPGDTSTASGVATATVVSPISLTHNPGAALSFGILTSGNGGTISVSALGVATQTGEVSALNGSTVSADAFTVAGDPNRSFTITTTSGVVSSGTNSMAFTTGPSATTGTLSGTGAAAFTVGGTLTVASGQAVGAYAGSYSATVTYN